MELLAIYTNEDPPRIILRDIESSEFVHTIEPAADTRPSLYWRAVDWAARNGHKIAETDRSGLTNGECDPHHDDVVQPESPVRYATSDMFFDGDGERADFFVISEGQLRRPIIQNRDPLNVALQAGEDLADRLRHEAGQAVSH